MYVLLMYAYIQYLFMHDYPLKDAAILKDNS